MKTNNLLIKLQRMSKELNNSQDTIINSAYWNKFKDITHIYFRTEHIEEISVIKFNELTGLNKPFALILLKQMNKEYFENKALMQNIDLNK
jgi:hypothetical protein